MAKQFDEIGETYEGVKRLPMARYPERSSFLDMLGDLSGKSVLDLACGTGFYTRHVRRLGAERVVGVDIAGEMIVAARTIEEREPLGISYQVADVASLSRLGVFDTVTAVYLLNYAPDELTLERMSRSVYANLADGGEFLVLTQNPAFSFAGPNATKYGFTFVELGLVPLGRRVRIVVDLRPPVSFETFIIDAPVYERVLKSVGFRDIKWVPMHVPRDAVRKYGLEYWEDFLANPPLAMLRCLR
jgi:SAM-dependent methyltransferase